MNQPHPSNTPPIFFIKKIWSIIKKRIITLENKCRNRSLTRSIPSFNSNAPIYIDKYEENNHIKSIIQDAFDNASINSSLNHNKHEPTTNHDCSAE